MKTPLFLALAGAALWAAPAGAAVKVQCPGDGNGDAVIDAIDPDHPNAKCMHLSAGDGMVRMADGRAQYIFGFADVTGTPATQVMQAGRLAANFSAPTIMLDEGDEFFLTVSNVSMVNRPDLFDAHTVHWHGYPNASAIFDGVPEASLGVNIGSSFTYYYNVNRPGTFLYHCHQEATEHMQMGMLGNHYVRPAQNRLPNGTVLGGHVHRNPDNPDGTTPRRSDNPLVGDTYVYNDGDGKTRYDVEYPVQLAGFDSAFHDASLEVQPLPFATMTVDYGLINGRGYPDTVDPKPILNQDGKPAQPQGGVLKVKKGQKMLLRISSVDVTRYYTLTAGGLPMKVVGRGATILRGKANAAGKDLAFTTGSVTLGGGEAVDVIVDTATVPAGTYALFAANLRYLANGDEDLGGMMTEIVVE